MSKEEVENIVRSLDGEKTPGPDQIKNKSLQNNIQHICKLIAHIQ